MHYSVRVTNLHVAAMTQAVREAVGANQRIIT